MQGQHEQAKEQQQPEQQPQERPRCGAAGSPARRLHVSLHGVREAELVGHVAKLSAGLSDLEGVRHGHAAHLRGEAGQSRDGTSGRGEQPLPCFTRMREGRDFPSVAQRFKRTSVLHLASATPSSGKTSCLSSTSIFLEGAASRIHFLHLPTLLNSSVPQK